MSSNVKPVLSIYDSKSKTYSDPQVFSSVADAMRSLVVLAEKNPDHPWVKFSADFQPFHIANWNAELAKIEPISHPQGLGTIQSIIPAPAPSSNLSRFPTPMHTGIDPDGDYAASLQVGDVV